MSHSAINENSIGFPLLDHFIPLYTTVRHKEFEACQKAVLNGEDLSNVLPGKSAKWVRLAYETAEEAEETAYRFIQLEEAEWPAFPRKGLSDFTLATLFTIAFEGGSVELVAQTSNLADEIFCAILDSNARTPFLDYEWMAEEDDQYGIRDRLAGGK